MTTRRWPPPGTSARTGRRRIAAGCAREGLKRRGRAGQSLADETPYLSPLDEIADSGVTPAERLLEHFHGRWDGEVKNVFDEMAF